ncbi:hypothetical protein Ciccas_007721 [Cichlidogyrus casuarinus]|uniref:Uncharacterized protein n=1 Tax=Cichlidogyrus casuarinus TaxID=1844966 RepID=A0ABD2Q4P0_9PLAT
MSVKKQLVEEAIAEYKEFKYEKWHSVIARMDPSHEDYSAKIVKYLLVLHGSLDFKEATEVIKTGCDIMEKSIRNQETPEILDLLLSVGLTHNELYKSISNRLVQILVDPQFILTKCMLNTLEKVFDSMPMADNLIVESLLNLLPKWTKSADALCVSYDTLLQVLFTQKISQNMSDTLRLKVFEFLFKQLTELDINRTKSLVDTTALKLDLSEDILPQISKLSYEILADSTCKCDLLCLTLILRFKSIHQSADRGSLSMVNELLSVFMDCVKSASESRLIKILIFSMLQFWSKLALFFIESLLRKIKTEQCNPNQALSLVTDFVCHAKCHPDVIIECLRDLGSLLLVQDNKLHQKFYHVISSAFFSILISKHKELLESPDHFRAVSKLGINKILLSYEDPLRHLSQTMRQLLMKILHSYSLSSCVVQPDQEDPCNLCNDLDAVLVNCSKIKFILTSNEYPLTLQLVHKMVPPFTISPKVKLDASKNSPLKAGMKRPSSVAFDLSRLSRVQ